MYKLGLTVSLFILMCASAFAQGTSTFNGRVVDQAGAVITGATVSATDKGTGAVRTATTNADGLYNITALNPGTYDVRAENTGFAPSLKQGMTLVVGTTLTLDFTLGVAGTTQTIEVTEVAPLVETSQSHASANLQRTEVQELPMLNRTLGALINLTPGVREETATVGVPGTSTTHTYFNVGGNGRSNQVLVDGIDNHDDIDAGATMQYSLEGIEEFKILAHGASTEYGRSGGAVVTMLTRSGTNQIHGSVFGYGRSDAMTRTDYFADPIHGGTGKAPYSREQYGGSIGGPIKKDKAWYAGSIERINQQYRLPISSLVTNQAALLTPANLGVDIGVLPASSINQPYNDLVANAKANSQLSQKHTMFVRYAVEHALIYNGSLAQNSALMVGAPDQQDVNHFYTTDWAVGETWLINSNTINQFGWQYLHYKQNDYGLNCMGPTDAGQGTPLGLTLLQCLLRTNAFPSVLTGASSGSASRTLFTGGYPSRDEKKFQFKDDFSKQIGKHSLKFGGDYVYVPSLGGTFATSAGGITWFDDPTTILANTTKYPQGFKTPGAVKQIALITQNTRPEWKTLGARYFGTYVNDDVKVTPRLTLNLGLRYDIYRDMDQPEWPKNRIYQVLKTIGSPFGALPHTDLKDFQPRVGLAWDIQGDGKNVVRASYGLYVPAQCITPFYTPDLFQKDSIYYTQTFQNSQVGSGALGSYVFGDPLPVAFPPSNPTSLPVGARISTVTVTNTGWFSPDIKQQREQVSHIGYSRQLRANESISADVTDIFGYDEWRPVNINPICSSTLQGECKSPGFPGAAGNKAGSLPPGVTSPDRVLTTALQQFYGDPNLLGPMAINTSWGRSHYDEMAIAYQYRGTRLYMQASYVLSYAYAYGAEVGGMFTNGSSYAPEIPNAYGGCMFCAGEYGPGFTDERHRFVLTGVIKAPFGFQIAPAFTVGSPLPYQQYRATNPDGDGNLRCYVGCTSAVPNTGTPGVTPTVSVNAARGQWLVNLNTRVSKSFKITETKDITGFVEMYNLANRPNFGANFGANAFSAGTFNKPVAYLGGPGSASTVPNSFQMQLGARFSF